RVFRMFGQLLHELDRHTDTLWRLGSSFVLASDDRIHVPQLCDAGGKGPGSVSSPRQSGDLGPRPTASSRTQPVNTAVAGWNRNGAPGVGTHCHIHGALGNRYRTTAG